MSRRFEKQRVIIYIYVVHFKMTFKQFYEKLTLRTYDYVFEGVEEPRRDHNNETNKRGQNTWSDI